MVLAYCNFVHLDLYVCHEAVVLFNVVLEDGGGWRSPGPHYQDRVRKSMHQAAVAVCQVN